ncbi:MAG: hypothetical protein AAGD13_05355 [Pseudomonadota bacterium]
MIQWIACVSPKEMRESAPGQRLPLVPNTAQLAQLKLYRDTYSYEMMRAYDLALQDYGRSLSVEGRGGSFFEHLLSLGLITAAGISKVQESARVLNLLSAAVIGAGDGYSESVLVNQTVPALLKKMRAAQSAKRAEIIGLLRSQDVTTYPLSAARLDLSELGGVSTIDAAIVELNSDAEQSLMESKIEEKAVKTIQRCDGDDTAKMAEWFFTGNIESEDARAEQLKEFLSEKKEKNVDPVELIYGCNLAGLRKSFIKEVLEGGS